MNRICIIPCGAKKIWNTKPEIGSTVAEKVYIGAFHNACQKYTRKYFDKWVILSAKHGFLMPKDIVPCNYDVSFNHKGKEVIDIEELKKQMTDIGIDQIKDVVVLGGKKYVKVVEQLYDASYKLSYPLSGCKGIGFMLQRLNSAVNQNIE
jgi:hypothetical protein